MRRGEFQHQLAAGRHADLTAIQDAMVQSVPYLTTRITAPAEVNFIARVIYPANTGAAHSSTNETLRWSSLPRSTKCPA